MPSRPATAAISSTLASPVLVSIITRQTTSRFAASVEKSGRPRLAPVGITHQAPKEGRLRLANVDRVSTTGRESSASTPPLGQWAQHDPAEEREDACDEEGDAPRCRRDHVREADRRNGASEPEHRLL